MGINNKLLLVWGILKPTTTRVINISYPITFQNFFNMTCHGARNSNAAMGDYCKPYDLTSGGFTVRETNVVESISWMVIGY